MKTFFIKLRAFVQRLSGKREHEPETLALDQTLVIEKPGTAQLNPMPETPAASKPEAKARPISDTEDQASAASENAPQKITRSWRMRRLRMLVRLRAFFRLRTWLNLHKVLRRKRVWIPVVTLVLLAVIGGVTMLILQSAREKEALMVELQKAKKQLQQQTKQAPPPITNTAPAAPDKTALAGGSASPANRTSTPEKSGTECVISNKESVAENLKSCIDNFNNNVKQPTKKAR